MTDFGVFLILASIFANFTATFISRKPMGFLRATVYFGSTVTVLVGFVLVFEGGFHGL